MGSDSYPLEKYSSVYKLVLNVVLLITGFLATVKIGNVSVDSSTRVRNRYPIKI